MQRKVPPEPWHLFLRELDAKLAQKVELHCMGGFVVTQMYGFHRQTADLDVLAVVPRQQRESLQVGLRGGELHRKSGVHIDLVTITTLPEDYDQRLMPMFAGIYKKLRLLALDPYDLVLSKLERNIERDREDVKHLARTVPLNLSILKKRYTRELRPYLGRPEREGLTLQLWVDAIEEERTQKK